MGLNSSPKHIQDRKRPHQFPSFFSNVLHFLYICLSRLFLYFVKYFKKISAKLANWLLTGSLFIVLFPFVDSSKSKNHLSFITPNGWVKHGSPVENKGTNEYIGIIRDSLYFPHILSRLYNSLYFPRCYNLSGRFAQPAYQFPCSTERSKARRERAGC